MPFAPRERIARPRSTAPSSAKNSTKNIETPLGNPVKLALCSVQGLIHTVAEAGEEAKHQTPPILARLKRACLLGANEKDHAKLRALARQILADWDAVVAFVKNPGLPPTNNDAERALRHAVLSRRICFGT